MRTKKEDAMAVTKEWFGKMQNGEEVYKFTIYSAGRNRVSLGEIGGAILQYWVPGKDGIYRDIALGYDSVAEYEDNPDFLCSLLGRLISHPADETLHFEGKDYPLAPGKTGIHMHGGMRGFTRVRWTGRIVSENSVAFSYVSKDGEEGYPGTVYAEATYTLGDQGELSIAYHMSSDSRTVVNPSNHAHMNLNGYNGADVGNHVLEISAKGMFDLDSDVILPLTKGTDLRQGRVLSSVFQEDDPEITTYNGLDHLYVLEGTGFKQAARAYSPLTGIELSCWTDLPAIMVMTAGAFDGSLRGKGGCHYKEHGCIAFETMLRAGNRKLDEISPIIDPENPYHSVTKFIPGVVNEI